MQLFLESIVQCKFAWEKTGSERNDGRHLELIESQSLFLASFLVVGSSTQTSVESIVLRREGAHRAVLTRTQHVLAVVAMESNERRWRRVTRALAQETPSTVRLVEDPDFK